MQCNKCVGVFVAYSTQWFEVPTIATKRHGTQIVIVNTKLRVCNCFYIHVFWVSANVDVGTAVFELETTIM